MSEEDTEIASDKNYEILAQIYNIIHDKMSQKGIAMKKVLKKEFDVNYSVPSSKCSLPKIVGRTALDFALDKRGLEVFQMLISHGADFTSKNQSGSTILHRIIEKSYVKNKHCCELKGILEDPFAETVLSAHIELKNIANPCNEDGISHFHIACMFNHVEAVNFFLAQGVCVNQAVDQDSEIFPGFTPLHLAARYSAVETAKLLLEHEADVNLQDARGVSPIVTLIERNNEIADWENIQKENLCEKMGIERLNNENMIKLLLEKSENNESGLSRCHVACTLSNTEILEQIMAEDVNLEDFVDKNSAFAPGYTALHFAANFNIEAMKLLLINGADITSKDANGVTPFDMCLQRYSPRVIHSIVSRVPEYNNITFKDTQIKLADLILSMSEEDTFRFFIQQTAGNVNISLPFDSPVWPGYTILHIAVILSDRVHGNKHLYKSTDYGDDCRRRYKHYKQQEYFKRIKLCLTMGADVTVTDCFNSTPLHLAFRLQNPDIVELLLEYHHTIINVVDNDKLSHLHIACTVDQSNLPEKLLEAGIDANQPIMSNLLYQLSGGDTIKVLHINPGWTCLHIAVACLNDKVVDVLMRFGADLYAKDSYGMTVIHRILHARYESFSDVHLSAPKYFSERVTDFGLSHLHVACYDGDIEKVKYLIEHGADIEATINYNLICSNSALAELAPYDGYTPLHFALKERHLEIVKLLVERGDNSLFTLSNEAIPFYEILQNSISELDFKYLDYAEAQNDSSVDEDEDYNDCYSDDKSAGTFALKLLSIKKIEHIIMKDSGITKLHIACLRLRRKMVMQLLQEGADPNAQIHTDYPIWPGFTPLHILMIPFSARNFRDMLNVYRHIGDIGRSLLNHGASVTLKDAKGNTPIHKVPYLLWLTPQVEEGRMLYFIEWILNGLEDFNENPVDAFGMSHFDVACMCTATAVVKNFLNHGIIDVNRRFGHFSKYYGGFTALHLVSFHKNNFMVDLLLRNGANYHAKDFLGNTPLHTAGVHYRFRNNGTRSSNENIYRTLREAGADIEARNLWNETPLGVILRMKLISATTLDYLFGNRTFCINIFNLENEEGLLAIAKFYAYRPPDSDIRNARFYRMVIDDPKLNDTDEMGRTVIHNVVSIRRYEYMNLRPVGTSEEYTKVIYGFMNLEFDIDYQDNQGQTALHKTVRFSNCDGIIGLLNNGADINLLDSRNKPAFAYSTEFYGEVIRRNILQLCLLHVHKLQLAGLEVSNANQNIVAQIRQESISCDRGQMELCAQELEVLKNQIIDETNSITMYDFLSKTLIHFHTLLHLRDDIDEIFVTRNAILHQQYPQFVGLLQMQYRNIFIRMQLIEPAILAFNVLTEYALPELCTERIIKSLKNGDLRRLIAASQ